MQEVYDFLKKCGTYYLATEENGQPRVRPFGTVNIFDGKLYLQTGKNKERCKADCREPEGGNLRYERERLAPRFSNTGGG